MDWLAAVVLVPIVACSGPDDRGTDPIPWSIETAEVVFTATRDGVSDLYVLSRQTGEPRRLTTVGTADGGANAPSVSPDGRAIAFQVRRGTDYEREGQWLTPTAEPDPLIAVHLASREPHAGWKRVLHEGRDLFLEPEPIVSDADIADVAATPGDEGVILDVRLTTTGAERLRRVTAEHIGEPLAIVLESRVVTTPVIRSAIAGGRVQMAVPASDGEAARLTERVRSRWPGGG